MIDLTDEKQDQIVEILIEDKKLSLVTHDPIAREDMDLVVDANEGVLMGKLQPGTLSSFYDFCKRSA